jgi:hypothetical protein
MVEILSFNQETVLFFLIVVDFFKDGLYVYLLISSKKTGCLSILRGFLLLA